MTRTIMNCFTYPLLIFSLLLGYQLKLQAQNQSNLIQLNRIFDVNSKTASDSLGYMWISDQDGLYKFDGYDFKKTAFSRIFGKGFKNKSCSLFEKDSHGNFWIGTDNGELVRMAPNGQLSSFTKEIRKTPIGSLVSNKDRIFFGSTTGEVWSMEIRSGHFKRLIQLPKTKGDPSILDMALSEKGELYISAVENNVYTYKLSNNILKRLSLPFANESQDMLFMVTDNRNRLWVSTEYQGLLCYDPTTKGIKRYGEPGNDGSKYIMYRSIYCDRDGMIWLGTDGYGLRCLDPNTGKISSYEHQLGNIYSLSNNTVRYINGDENGNIWVILKGGIVQVLSHKRYPIRTYSGLPNQIPHRILSILKTRDKSIWIGTDGRGLSMISPNGHRQHFDISKGFKGRFVQALAEDKLSNIWIATYQNGLFHYKKSTATFEEVPVGKLLNIPLLKDFRNIYVDLKGRIWVSSTYAIHVFNAKVELLATFPYDNKRDKAVIADAVFEDREGQIWIGYSDGLLMKFIENRSNLSKSGFKSIVYHPWENKAPRYYSITQCSQDKFGMLWFRCEGGFIIRFDPKKLSYQSFENHSALKNIDIMSLLVDRDGLLWIGSRNGLHQFDPQRQRILNYTMHDGLQDNLFIRKSAFQAIDEELFFGGNNGVSSFYSKSIIIKPITANLVINGIQVLNKPYEEAIDSLQHIRVEHLRHLKLKANQSSFSISFAAIGNLLNNNYRYQYRLKGFEENYSEPGEARTATYTNLPAGIYVFEVVAAQQGSSLFNIGPLNLTIEIAPYWWQSWPAKIVYLFILLAITYAILRWIGLRAKLQREEVQRRQEKDLYRMKVNFFAKISHEIQTPLSLIIGPLESLFAKKEIKEVYGQGEKELMLIRNNADRLSRIVAELTHVRDKEIGKLKLSRSKSDIIAHVQKIVISFEQLARHKGIDFTIHVPLQQYFVDYDYLKIEHVIYNLLGNAIKFTPAEGKVAIRLEIDSHLNSLSICVEDSGPGMDDETITKAFQIFYQGTLGREIGGLGIGLALSKEIAQLHNGTLELESQVGVGSCFTMKLPFSSVNVDEQARGVLSDEKNEITMALSRKAGIVGKEILIVEDNLDMQLFLSELLIGIFGVTVANDGKQALKILQTQQVDLIVSDVMMPGMDGLQLVEEIHKNTGLKHIPVILLTAFPSDENKKKGLMAGVVSYLSKPFHPDELILLMENLLANQQHAIIQYRNKMTSMPVVEESKLAKSDSFLMKLTEILKTKVADPSFLLEDLEQLLHMSYSVIFKKCQEATGCTPSEYFRRIKIKKAAILLVRYNYAVSEAAFEVGFTDSKYFSRLFKDIFGLTPSAFKNQITDENLEQILQKF